MRPTGWPARATAAAAGLAFALGQAPFDLWWVALPALAVPLWLARGAAPRAAAWLGWWFATGYYLLSLFWILEPFQVDAATTGWMAPFALALISGGLALFAALPFWLAARLGGGWRIVPLWALAELARSYLFTGFPWGLVGYVWAPTAAAQWAALIGPHGLTLLALGTAWLIAEAPARRALWPAAAATALWGLALGGGAWMMPPPSDLTDRPVLRLVQPNAPQSEKWDPARIPVFFNRLIDATAVAPPPDLILWPETALPMSLGNAGEALAIARDAARGAPILTGIQRSSADRWYNSAILLDGAGEIADLYDKHHLVPFGEYMPAARLFAHVNIGGLAARAEGGYSAGPGPRLIDLGPLGTALPLICYEAVFPQDVNAAPARPDMLLHLTNDAWFGTWSGPYQHLAQSRMRAIEQGLPLARAANTGVSAMIDPAGRILAEIPLGETGHVDALLPSPLPPTLYSRTGDWPVLALLLAAVTLGALRRPKYRIDATTPSH